MEFLALIYDIDIVVRFEIFFSLNDGRKVGSRVEGRAIGFSYDTRRKLLGIGRLGDINNESTLALICKSFILEVLDQARDIRLRVALTFPQVEIHVKVCVVSL